MGSYILGGGAYRWSSGPRRCCGDCGQRRALAVCRVLGDRGDTLLPGFVCLPKDYVSALLFEVARKSAAPLFSARRSCGLAVDLNIAAAERDGTGIIDGRAHRIEDANAEGVISSRLSVVNDAYREGVAANAVEFS